MKTLIKVVLGIGLLMGLAVGALFVFVDLDEIVNEQKDLALPQVEEALGRKVSIGKIETSILPVLGVQVSKVEVAGAKTGDDPLLSIGTIRVRLAL